MKKKEKVIDRELLENILEVRDNLSNMHNNMQLASSDLVDYYAYQIKAEEAKYDYLIKQAKLQD